MHCRHEGALTAQGWACGELAALGIPWRAECCCPDCGRLVRLVWRAGLCAVWEGGAAGFVLRRQVAAPAAEERPLDAGAGPDGDATAGGRQDAALGADGPAPDRPTEPPVLVVEDDQDTRELLQTVLEEADVAVALVATGEAATVWLAQQRPALLLLDALLPDARGQDIAQAARQRYGLALPILVVSGAPHAWTASMANVVALPKPFDRSDLLWLVQALCRPVPLPAGALRRRTHPGGREPRAPRATPALSPPEQVAERRRHPRPARAGP